MKYITIFVLSSRILEWVPTERAKLRGGKTMRTKSKLNKHAIIHSKINTLKLFQGNLIKILSCGRVERQGSAKPSTMVRSHL